MVKEYYKKIYIVRHMCVDCKGSKMEKGANEKMEEFLNKEDKPTNIVEHPYDIAIEELKKKQKEDMVNSPKHYTFGKYEVIDIIDDWQLEFYEGQVIKYVARAKHKGNELQDLKKAQFYLNRLIKKMESDIKEK